MLPQVKGDTFHYEGIVRPPGANKSNYLITTVRVLRLRRSLGSFTSFAAHFSNLQTGEKKKSLQQNLDKVLYALQSGFVFSFMLLYAFVNRKCQL